MQIDCNSSTAEEITAKLDKWFNRWPYSKICHIIGDTDKHNVLPRVCKYAHIEELIVTESTIESYQPVSMLLNLHTLLISHTSQINGLAGVIRGLPSLKYLWLNNIPLSFELHNAILESTTLEWLELLRLQFDNDFCSVENESVRQICLRSCIGVSARVLGCFVGTVRLHLARGIWDENILAAIRAMPSLQHLELIDVELELKDMRAITQVGKLQYIKVTGDLSGFSSQACSTVIDEARQLGVKIEFNTLAH